MDFLDEEIRGLQKEGLYRSLKLVHSPQGPEILIDGKKVLNFCSNNYLGLANDPRLVEAVIEVARKYGAGSGAARLISGNYDLQEELESALARFKGTEAALLFNSGYHANIGVIPALAGEGDLIFSDEFNHASLVDGCRLSKAEKVIYRHNDLNHLEDLLRRGVVPAPGRGNPAPTRKIIVTEAVFSMEGDLCQLSDLLGLAEKYGATVYLDEAHAVGVFGENGEGLAPKGVRHQSNQLICMGTLGKALGSYGAFVAGSRPLRDYLINTARSFIFTTALPPAVLGASLAALKIVVGEPERRRQLWDRVLSLREGFAGGMSPIFSIRIGDARKTIEISEKLLEAGIFIQGIRPPSVPEGTSRLRLTMMATHTKDHLDRLNQAWKTIL